MNGSAADPSGCPFDPLDPEIADNPYPHLVEARRSEPVFYMPEYEMWCVTRRDDVLEVMKEPNLYSNAPYTTVAEIPEMIKAEVGDDFSPPITTDQILTVDPPHHTRLRKAFQPAFTPRSVGRSEEMIKATVEELIDGFVDQEEVDFVDAFASPLPLTVIGAVLGLPPGRRHEFRDYIEAAMRAQMSVGLPESELIAYWRTILDFDPYFTDFLDSRRSDPRDDLTSVVLQTAKEEAGDGEPLGDRSLSSSIIGLAIAGGDTTAILLTHMMYALLSDRERWGSVNEDRALVPKVIEETMRLNGPVVALLRSTTDDVELGGVAIPKGSVLYLHIGSANHDESEFDHPEEFDLTRENLSKHLGFGIWTHFCIGAPLARLEARVALECLLDRLPEPELVDPDEPLRYVPNFLFPQVQSMRIRLRNGDRSDAPTGASATPA